MSALAAPVTVDVARTAPVAPPASPLALVALALSAFLGSTGFFSVSVILPQMQAAYAALPNSTLMTTLVAGVTPMAFALSSPWMGRVIDRRGYRAVYAISLLIFTAAGTLAAFMPSLTAILLTRLLLGVAVSGVLNAGSAGIAALPEPQRGMMFGIQATMGGLFGVLIFPAVGWIAGYGWRWAFAVHLLALLAVFPALALKDARPVHALAGRSAGNRSGAPTPLIVLAVFCGLAIFAGPVFSPFFLKGIGVVAPGLVSIPLLAMSVVSLPSSTLYGAVQRRIGTAGTFVASLGLIGGGLLLAGLSHALAPFTGGLALLGAGLGLLMPNLNAAAAAARPHAAGRAVALINACVYGPQAVFPFLVIPLSAMFGPVGVFLGAGVVGAALAAAYAVRPGLAGRPA